MRPASASPSRARRRAFALVVTLVATFGAVTACGDDGPETPAISGDSPGEVTIPSLPPTTTSAAPGSGDSDAGAEQQDTDTSAPSTTATAGESDSPTTAPSSG